MAGVYDIVMSNRKELVDTLIKNMEKGYIWTENAWNSAALRPYNPASECYYLGGNRARLMLAAIENSYDDPRWCTYKQAQANGWAVKRGAQSVLLEKWIFTETKTVENEFGEPEKVTVELDTPKVNYFRVFNASQIHGIPKLEALPDPEYDSIIEAATRSSKCPIEEKAVPRACYIPNQDIIEIPPRFSFKSAESYLSVQIHEMCHSTGHADRLNRSLLNTFGSPDYAREELRAELGAAFFKANLNLPLSNEQLQDHSNYLASWIKVLEDDPNEFFRACKDAEKISDYLQKNYENVLEKQLVQEQELSDKLRLFVDMDGTLTEFIPQASTAPLYQQGYFAELPPHEKVIAAIKEIIENHPEIEVNILSAYLTNSKYALEEKNQWLDKHLPEIDKEHRIFVPNGSNKKEFIGQLTKNDFLLDDYTPNLMKWLPGRGIKLLNAINHTRGTWQYDRIRFDREPADLAKGIVNIVKSQEHIYDKSENEVKKMQEINKNIKQTQETPAQDNTEISNTNISNYRDPKNQHDVSLEKEGELIKERNPIIAVQTEQDVRLSPWKELENSVKAVGYALNEKRALDSLSKRMEVLLKNNLNHTEACHLIGANPNARSELNFQLLRGIRNGNAEKYAEKLASLKDKVQLPSNVEKELKDVVHSLQNLEQYKQDYISEKRWRQESLNSKKEQTQATPAQDKQQQEQLITEKNNLATSADKIYPNNTNTSIQKYFTVNINSDSIPTFYNSLDEALKDYFQGERAHNVFGPDSRTLGAFMNDKSYIPFLERQYGVDIVNPEHIENAALKSDIDLVQKTLQEFRDPSETYMDRINRQFLLREFPMTESLEKNLMELHEITGKEYYLNDLAKVPRYGVTHEVDFGSGQQIANEIYSECRDIELRMVQELMADAEVEV